MKAFLLVFLSLLFVTSNVLAANCDRMDRPYKILCKQNNRIIKLLQQNNQPTNPGQCRWTRCALEGSVCRFSGTKKVRYGLPSNWSTETLNGNRGISCSNHTFGDPMPGVQKRCEYLSCPPRR